jgi:predicted transcriptional regulator
MTTAILERETPVSVRFPKKINKKLSSFSQRRKRTKSSLIQEAVENYFELQEWKIAGVKKAIKEMRDGKGIDGDIAMEWFDRLGTDEELPMPT